MEKVTRSILPELNDINTPWLKIIESSDDLRSAVVQMRRQNVRLRLRSSRRRRSTFGLRRRSRSSLLRQRLAALKGTRADVRFLKGLLSAEIDHRNILNMLEAEAVGFSNELIVECSSQADELCLSVPFSSIAAGGKDACSACLRTAARFDAPAFEEALAAQRKSTALMLS